MDLTEFLKQINLLAPQNTSIGNQELNLNAYTKPTLGVNANAVQPTDIGLLSATMGKNVNEPAYKDVALNQDNMRYGVTNQAGNTAPYTQYTEPNLMVKAMGGNNPNISGNYMTDLMGGKASVGGQYDASGLSAMAAYQKKLQDEWLLKAFLQANPYSKSAGIQLGKEF
ncbi:hypothetical protein UFOVP89_58 [uncultured Caudovirales phage]|uniref:Uncharacterized protein n=1 Tax=uncultured Caudovirales phage TaxID=2100421 RepID=A0A6J5KVK6_9CAUD|nr:hypothetical protein UFOVP89_58 [uncultured Caudovirales phage]